MILLRLAALLFIALGAWQQGEQPQTEDMHTLPPVVSEAVRTVSFTEGEPGEESSRYWVFAGRMHPLVVHFPIAMILAAALAQILASLRASSLLRACSRYCLWLGAMGASLSVLCGLAAEETTIQAASMHDIVEQHERFGFITLGLAVLALLLGELRVRSESSKLGRLYPLTLLLAAAFVVLAGHFGGTLVFGTDHFTR